MYKNVNFFKSANSPVFLPFSRVPDFARRVKVGLGDTNQTGVPAGSQSVSQLPSTCGSMVERIRSGKGYGRSRRRVFAALVAVLVASVALGVPQDPATANGLADPAASFDWATRAGGVSFDSGTGVSVLADGSGAIVTGRFRFTATFALQSNETDLVSAGEDDVFVAKIDGGGNWLWATKAGGTQNDQGLGVSVLADGSGAIVVGSFSGTATFARQDAADIQLESAGGVTNVFVAKIDGGGNWLWATKAGSTGNGQGMDVSVLADGSGAIIAGSFSGTATFARQDAADIQLESADGSVDVFVAKIDGGGKWLWAAKAGGGIGTDDGRSVSVFSDGSAIVTGRFAGTEAKPATFTRQDAADIQLVSAGGAPNVFVAKIDDDGNWLWANSAGSTLWTIGKDVSVLADG